VLFEDPPDLGILSGKDAVGHDVRRITEPVLAYGSTGLSRLVLFISIRNKHNLGRNLPGPSRAWPGPEKWPSLVARARVNSPLCPPLDGPGTIRKEGPAYGTNFLIEKKRLS